MVFIMKNINGAIVYADILEKSAKDQIIANIHDTIYIDKILKPVYNFKAKG